MGGGLKQFCIKNENVTYKGLHILILLECGFSDFRADLITYYRENESNVPICPLVEEHDVPLMEFYVRPPMVIFNKPHILSESTEPRKPVEENDTAQINKKLNENQQTKITSYRELFFQENGTPFKKIYLTADAGMGKTSFSQHITMYWCQYHKPVEQSAERYLKHDLIAIKEFDLLFLLHLREFENSSKCNLDDLVIEMCSNLSRRSRYNIEFLETLLHEKRCLIVLDGLDEWTHPSSCHRKPCVPHNSHPKNCTVLTTTRTWKFGTIGLSSAHIDRHVEILEFDSCSSKELENNVIVILKKRGQRDTCLTIRDFHKSIASIENEGICNIPYIKLQLLNLWYDGIPISKSRVELYSNIIELTLTRGLKRSNIPLIQTSHQDLKPEVPKYMKNNTLCVQYINLLSKIGQIAFFSLFSKTKKLMLIFDQDIVLQYLTETELEFCLKTGLLSQYKDSSRLSKLCYKVSFQHKSIHEFFAGLHISVEWRNNITTEILDVCQSLFDIVELSNVFIFVSGMNPEQYSAISYELKNVVARDQIVCSYRSMNDIPNRLNMIRKIYSMTLYQNMQVACFKENLNMGSDECKLPIQDIFINRYCDYSDSSALTEIVKFNAQSFKSINIDTCTSDGKSLHVYIPTPLNVFDVKISTCFQILTGSTNSLTTVYFYNIHVPVNLLWCFYKCIADIRTLTEICMEHIRTGNINTKSHFLVLNFCKQSELQHLYLTNIPISGLDLSQTSQLKQLLLANVPLGELDLTKNSQLQHLYLTNVPLRELDLSQTSHLEILQLTKTRIDELYISNSNALHLSKLHVNAEYLQQCFISICSLSHTYFHRLTESIQKSKNLKILVLQNTQCSDRYEMGDGASLNLCQHIHLQKLQLDNILLSALDISQNRQLQKLELNRVPLSALDISQNTQLQKLQLNKIPISVLEISENSKIEQLHLTAIALRELKVNATSLQDVEINSSTCLLSHNNLFELVSSIQSGKNLERLTLASIQCLDHDDKCTGFQLKLSQHIKLQKLNLDKIPITMLDISKGSKLQQLQIQNTPIEMLDISQSCSLWKLLLLDMPLTELHLPLTSKLHKLKLKKVRVQQLDLSNACALQKLYLEGIFLSGLDLSQNKLLNKIRLNKVHLTSGWDEFLGINAHCQWSISVTLVEIRMPVLAFKEMLLNIGKKVKHCRLTLTQNPTSALQDIISSISNLQQSVSIELHDLTMSVSTLKDVFRTISHLSQHVRLTLSKITMSATAWRELLAALVDILPRPVTVELYACTGPTREEWTGIESMIRSSQSILVRNCEVRRKCSNVFFVH